MRISDWSSDVCSSDLGRFVTARTKGLNLHRYAYAGSVRIFDAAQPPQFAIIEAVGIARVRGELRDRAVARGIGKIGRASCRERVCQYVSISVVAVSLKQQQNSTTFQDKLIQRN